jgi:hypothetical protein
MSIKGDVMVAALAHEGFEGDPAKSLDTAAERINSGAEAGDQYTGTMEKIREELNKGANDGTSVGTMVAATIAMTEADITFSTKKGLATNVSNKVKEAAKKIGDN